MVLMKASTVECSFVKRHGFPPKRPWDAREPKETSTGVASNMDYLDGSGSYQ